MPKLVTTKKITAPINAPDNLVKIFLIGFFIGNIISCIVSGFYNIYFKSPNLFFVINIIIFILLIHLYINGNI